MTAAIAAGVSGCRRRRGCIFKWNDDESQRRSATPMKTEKVCPFCGEHSTQILSPKSKPNTSTHAKGYQVECMNCGARGPCGMATPDGAARAWNDWLVGGDAACL